MDFFVSDTEDAVGKDVDSNMPEEGHLHLDNPTEPQTMWLRCLAIIKDNVNARVYKTWFEPIQAKTWTDNQLTIQVPSQFFYEWIEEHYYGLLQKTIKQILGPEARLQYQVVMDTSEEETPQQTMRLPAFRQAPAAPKKSLPNSAAPRADKQNDLPSYLNPRYTFENFIQGDSNQLAHAAAVAVSKNPGGTRYNPLVLYGDTGLGKTHLAQAIGNSALKMNGDLRVVYTNSERFTMEYVSAVQNNKINEFTNFYRNVDILIVDDIQFFSAKEKTQDNFFHTFNALHQAGSQIILTSDKAPRELQGVQERLISRFQWGLTADIQAPDYEMRLAILQRKAADEGGDEIPGNVLDFLARHVTSSVRELEGCLISLLAKVSLDARELNLDLAKEVVGGIASNTTRKVISIDSIQETVSEHFDIPVELITGKTRKHHVVLARQVAMFICKELTKSSLKMLGAHFGNRDHTTVIHSCQMIENYLETDPKVQKDVNEIFSKLGVSR